MRFVKSNIHAVEPVQSVLLYEEPNSWHLRLPMQDKTVREHHAKGHYALLRFQLSSLTAIRPIVSSDMPGAGCTTTVADVDLPAAPPVPTAGTDASPDTLIST